MTTQILLSQLDSDKQRISYRKDWNRITGSVTATILLQQAYYWYQKNDFKPFYKFKTAPGKPHQLYNPDKADDWCTELGFTEREFDGAIKKVGFKYTSKTKGDIHDKYIEYWTDSSRVTHYKLNMVNFLTALLDLYLNHNLSVSKTTKCDLAKLQIDIYQNYKLDFSKSTKSSLPITDTTQILPDTTTDRERAREKETPKTDLEKSKLTAERNSPSKKVARKKVSEPVPVHENDIDESFLSEPVPDLGQKHWTEVATEMSDYYKSTGMGEKEWSFMCDAAGGHVPPLIITTMWAGKASPYELKNWNDHTGKLTNWIKNNLKSTKQNRNAKTNDRLKVESFQGQQRKIEVSKVPL